MGEALITRKGGGGLKFDTNSSYGLLQRPNRGGSLLAGAMLAYTSASSTQYNVNVTSDGEWKAHCSLCVLKTEVSDNVKVGFAGIAMGNNAGGSSSVVNPEVNSFVLTEEDTPVKIKVGYNNGEFRTYDLKFVREADATSGNYTYRQYTIYARKSSDSPWTGTGYGGYFYLIGLFPVLFK